MESEGSWVGERGEGRSKGEKLARVRGAGTFLRRERGQYGMDIRGKRRRISYEERFARFPRHARARALS